jgi:inosine-uridine nucleoside N-ribohydrolase
MFDSDIGNRIDAALALSLLYGFDGKGDVRLVSVSVSKPNLKAAAFCDAMGNFYTSAIDARFRSFFRGLPIGLAVNGKLPEDTPMLTKPAYENSIKELTDTADVNALIRNALTAQHDQNSIVVLAGPATNLAGVLDMPGVKDLIAHKVRFLSVAADEFNIKTDITAAKRLFADWPGPIVASGQEIGEALPFPGASIEKDFAWATTPHPLVEAYRAYKTMPYDAPSWDMSAVLYAARPKEGYFKLSEPGTIRVTDDGKTKFTPSADGKHRYLILDPDQKERVIKTYTEVASAKPVARRPRFGQKKDDDKKDEEKKPDPQQP